MKAKNITREERDERRQMIKEDNRVVRLSEIVELKLLDHEVHTLRRMIKSGKIKGVNLFNSSKSTMWGIRWEDIKSYNSAL